VTVNSGSTSEITLTATGYKVKGVQYADLRWTGAAAQEVDIYRNGVRTTTLNDGFYTDPIGKKGGGTYTYQVCEAGSTAKCSNFVTIVF
jgi:hypothetical protein